MINYRNSINISQRLLNKNVMNFLKSKIQAGSTTIVIKIKESLNNMNKYSDKKQFASNSPIRRCTKCRKVLIRDKFYKIRSTLSGLDNYCKICRKISTSNNRGRFANGYRFVKPAKIIISQGNLVCVCCGNKNGDWLQVDHVIPLRRNLNDHSVGIAKLSREIVQGIISPHEFQLLCVNCNFAKGALEKCLINHSLD